MKRVSSINLIQHEVLSIFVNLNDLCYRFLKHRTIVDYCNQSSEYESRPMNHIAEDLVCSRHETRSEMQTKILISKTVRGTYAVSYKSVYTPHIFSNILLHLFMEQHYRAETLIQLTK